MKLKEAVKLSEQLQTIKKAVTPEVWDHLRKDEPEITFDELPIARCSRCGVAIPLAQDEDRHALWHFQLSVVLKFNSFMLGKIMGVIMGTILEEEAKVEGEPK